MKSSLTSRSFNRYKPYKIEEIDQRELRFVMFWGSLGKISPDDADFESIAFLKNFFNTLSGEVKLTVLLSDSHAEMNGIESSAYLSAMEILLKKEGFTVVYLSSLWKKWGIDIDLIRRKAETVQISDSTLSEHLERASKRHFKGKERGDLMYHAMRLLEKDHLEKEFKGYVFLTYNAPFFREILPDMPTLHLRSRKGSSEPPWIPG